MSEATRERVLAIAREIGWTPNSAARALSNATTQTIGLVLRRPPEVLGVEPFFMELISGIEGELSSRGFALTLQLVADSDAERSVYGRWWGERRVDGVLVCDLCVDDARIELLEQLSLPAVVVGGPAGVGSLPYVGTDDRSGIREVVGYLAALGHRRITRVAGLAELQHTFNRNSAFAEVAADLGLSGTRTVTADYTRETGARVTRQLLSSGDRPTAIIYDNDVMAIAGLAVAQEMGVQLPGDLSIVAWDDSPLCQMVHPSLTALGHDIPGQGAAATRMLLDTIDGKPLDQAGIEFAPRLLPRGSTAPPRRQP